MARNQRSERENRSFDLYLKEVGSAPRLRSDEEAQLFRTLRSGDPSVAGRLRNSHLRLVVKIVKESFLSYDVDPRDLIQEGNFGLEKAIKTFDPDRGVQFAAFAVTPISQQIKRFIAEHRPFFRLPVNAQQDANAIRRTRRGLEQKLERTPSPEELAECVEMGTKSWKVADALELLNASFISINDPSPFGENGDGNDVDHLIELQSPSHPDEDAERREARRKLRSALATLAKKHPREATIIGLYFGIDHGVGLTLEAIAEYFEVSQEHVSKLKQRALTRLGKILSKEFKLYFT